MKFKLNKKATLGFFAEPENEKEELVVKISDEMINKSSEALEKNKWRGWSTYEERQRGIDIVKEAIAPIVEKYKTELQDEEIFNMLYDHNEDNNYHTENTALEELLGKTENSLTSKKGGYSNNSDYVGDWFGDGQIDFSKIINPEDDGKVFMLKIWRGSGYILDVYLVKANDVYEAINTTFRWSYNNEGKNKVIKDYEYLSKLCKEDYESEYFYGKGEGKPSDKMSYEEFEENWFDESFIADDYYELFAYRENFFVDEVPENYLIKSNASLKKKADEQDYTEVTKKGYTYDQLSEEAKSKVRVWIAQGDPFSDDPNFWNEEFQNILTQNYGEYNINIHDLNIKWDSYDRASVDLKQGKPWPSFKSILLECAKQVLKDLPTFQGKPELLDDWAAEAASDMYYSGSGYFETYAGLNDLDGYDGYGLSYKICDLCDEAYETSIEPVLESISRDFTNYVSKHQDYLYSDENARETCEANEYLFDENGNLI